MCGIVGTIGSTITPERFASAREALAHRGPDSFAAYFDPVGRVALGHRRLAIIDLSPLGAQPMTSTSGRYVLVFNGEIFNYVELKAELTGYTFRSGSDSEVILAAYERWGKDCVKKFNGQFAFALYDKQMQTLFCARDHLGIKPFYYFQNGDTFAFASEIKALLKLGLQAVPNEKIWYQYLRFGMYDHSSETFFQNCFNLPAGSWLVYEKGKIAIEQYWDLTLNPDTQKLSKEESVQQFLQLFQDSLRLQFRSDVPIGLNLSSGLDSNALYYFAKQIYKTDLHIFTGCIVDDEYNECPVVESRLTKTEKDVWHTATLTPADIWTEAKELMAIQDEPYGGMPTIQYYHLYKQTAEMAPVKVLLEGQGVDEIMGGYNYYVPPYYRDALKFWQRHVFRRYFEITKKDGRSFWDALGGLFSLLLAGSGRSQDMSKEAVSSFLHPDFAKKWQEQSDLSWPRPFASHLLNAQYRDIKFTKLPRTLRFNDHISMAFSKELRVPYLDRRLVEFCFSLASGYKIKSGYHKLVLRKAMSSYLPEVMKKNKKKTFGAFQTDWFRRHFAEQVQDITTSRSFLSRSFLDHPAFQTQVQRFMQGQGNNSVFLWQAINLELWFAQFIDGQKKG